MKDALCGFTVCMFFSCLLLCLVSAAFYQLFSKWMYVNSLLFYKSSIHMPLGKMWISICHLLFICLLLCFFFVCFSVCLYG